MVNDTRDIYKKSRWFYILSAAVEYFISILVGSTYLAKLAGSIGLDDGTIGVLTSFISLGCGFQIVALFFRSDKPVKRMVVVANFINQLCFSFLYVIPLVDIPTGAKTPIFIILLLSGHVINNVVFSPKVIWARSLVDGDKLGRFSATCEIISLLSGIVFTMAMGSVIDAMEAAGNLNGAFIVCGVTLIALTLSNAVLLILMKEKKKEKTDDGIKLSTRLRQSLTDKATLKLIPVFVLWETTLYITTPFLGTYQLNELGFTMTFVSILTVAYSLFRSLVSTPLGMLGDKKSFVNMVTVAQTAELIGLVTLSLGGAASYIIYYMMYAVAIAGTNSGKMNLIYEYVPAEKRTGAVAILYTIGGFVGFFATLCAKPLVDHIQAAGNKFLWLDKVYAQQVLAIIASLILLLCILYTNTVVRRMRRVPRY